MFQYPSGGGICFNTPILRTTSSTALIQSVYMTFIWNPLCIVLSSISYYYYYYYYYYCYYYVLLFFERVYKIHTTKFHLGSSGYVISVKSSLKLHTYIHIYVYINIYRYTYTHTYIIHTCIHTYIYIYMHTNTTYT